jgi:hypothetical protein
MTRAAYALPGLDGQARGDSAFLCTNPITGPAAPIRPRPAPIWARWCPITDRRAADPRHGARAAPDGFLMIGPAPQMGPFVAPGNNYHVYDIPLFWANIRADFARRVGHGTASGRMTIPPSQNFKVAPVAALIFTGALDMRDALPEGGGLIGLDLGTQTIGTACDPTGASPRPARPSRAASSLSTRC